MEVAGLSDEHLTRPIVGHGSNGVRGRRGGRPRGAAVRPGPVTVREQAAHANASAASAQTADRLQADYFRLLLAQNRRHVDHRLGEYHKAIAAAEAAGDAEGASNLRRMARLDQQDRHTLDDLLANLQRRFPVRARIGGR
jgi:hypothetical protein